MCMKSKKIKPDDYYSNGIIELSRFGNVVSMKNNGTGEDRDRIIDYFYGQFNSVTDKINNLISVIKDDIIKSEPLGLLKFSKQISTMLMFNKLSEIEYNKDEISLLRCTEYIQSILVSNESKFNEEDDLDYESLYHKILSNVEKLYDLLPEFYYAWTAHAEKDLKLEIKLIEYIIESQMSFLVRGSRYQYYQLTDLETLLKFQNDKLIELFQMDYLMIISGLEKLEYSLTSGIIDAMNGMRKEFDEYQKLTVSKTDEEIEEIMSNKNLNESTFVGELFEVDLYDVFKVTKWSDKFIDALTLDLNSELSFTNQESYSAWPIRDLPIQKKPFIRIDSRVYCFDYYNLFDNIYRVIQKSIKELSPDYTTIWADKQKEASETLVENLFKEILPGAITYTDNYYPKNNSLKHCNENDLIVIYEDIVLIVEVKAGSFTYTSPMIDYKSHIKSFKDLVEKADKQCERTYEYVKKTNISKFYTSNKIEKFTLNQDEIREVYTMSITVDNFNEFEAKAEKIAFINMMLGSIVLNIDELRVYNEYFDSPVYFLHYLKERKEAAKSKVLSLNDELDHLGMYIKHNMYTLQFLNTDNARVNAYGYREDLDHYFGSLHIEELEYPKPVQEIPIKMKEIINFIEYSDMQKKSLIVNYLLDFAFDSRQQFCDTIQAMISRQKVLGRMITTSTYGELRYCIFIHQSDIHNLSEIDKKDYAFSNMILHNEKDRMVINLYYDSKIQLRNFSYEFLKYSDIPEDDYKRLSEKAKEFVKTRTETIKMRSGKRKIGRNDPCPCGSGKKYKKCCLI